LCDGDDDWFSLEVAEGEIIEVNLEFAHADGDVDLILQDPNEAVIGRGFSVTDNERIARRAVVGGTYLIKVFAFGDIDNSYSMSVDILPPESCFEDDYEENDDQENAALIFEGTRTALGLCKPEGESEEDWYRFSVREGQNITATVTFSHEAGDIDIELHSMGERVDFAFGFRDSETVEVENAPAGDYFLRVFTFSNAELRSEYDLLLDLE
jgi:hypothetical protein